MTNEDSAAGDATRERVERGTDFPSALATYSDTGATILVTGRVPSDVHARASRSYLGAVSEDPRRRVFVFAGHSPETVDRRLPTAAPRDPDHFQVVVNGSSRSGAATVDAGQSSYVDPRDRGSASSEPSATLGEDVLSRAPSGYDELGATAATVIESIAENADDLAPSELRVCMDSLAPIFEKRDTSSVAQFVHLLGSQVTAHRGQAYFHLPVARTDERVRALEPLVDIVVQLRVRGGKVEERWEIRDGPSSAWMVVDPEP